MNSKILDDLTEEWDMKVIATKESRNLNSITPRKLFGSLKAHEYSLNRKKEASTSSAQDAAFYGERTRFRDTRGRNNFRPRSSPAKEHQGGSSTE